MFNIIQILAWYLCLLLILTLLKKRPMVFFLSALLVGIGLLEIISIFLTDTLLDYRFYTHMNLESIKSFGFLFIVQIIILVVVYIIFVWLFIKFSSVLTISKKIHKFMIIIVILSLSYILVLPHGILQNFYNIYQITNAQSKTFTEALKDVGIESEKYVLPDEVKSKKGKNIIVISIESLEQGFLGQQFHNITPHLKKLTKEWTYFNNMPVSPGAGWTAGSLYTHQVGIPAFFKNQGFIRKNNNVVNEEGQGNDLFQNTSSTKLVGLGTVLRSAGYDSRYIMGYIEFAGVKDILETYGFKTISEMNSIGKYEHKRYGMDDSDLFKEVKLQINDMSKSDKPFALFMSTINTHFPNGVYDKKMEKYIKKQENILEFEVAAIDYLIHDLIIYLKNNGLYDTTAIYIFPDHLLMGRGGSVHYKLSKKKRQLYLLTNINENKFHKKIKDTIYQVDLPRMIIDGAEIKSNAKFLVDFIKPKNMIDFLDQNRIKLASLNSASVSRENFQDKITINLQNKNLFLKSGLNSLEFSVDESYLVKDFMFSPDMVLIKDEILYRQDIFKPVHYDIRDRLLHLTLITEEGKIKTAYLGNRQKVGIFKKGNSISFSKKEIADIMVSNKLFFQNESHRIREIKGTIKKYGEHVFDLKSSKNYISSNWEINCTESNNSIMLKALNDDPIMIINNMHVDSKYVLLKYTIDSTKNTLFQIFYKRKKSSFYNEGDSYSIKILKGVNEIKLLLPVEYINNGLRIDFVNTQGIYNIKDFSFYGMNSYEL